MNGGCRIWLVRHARPQVDAGLCYGATDIPACPVDTELAAPSLAGQLPEYAHWRMSGLVRAQQLAKAVLEQSGAAVSVQVDYRLNEMDFGVHEMQPWSRMDRAVFDAWEADFGAHRFGGRESVNELLQRVASAVCDALASGVSDHVWFTHAGVIQAVKQCALDHNPVVTMAEWPKAEVPFGGWVCQTFDGAALSRLKSLSKELA